MGDSQDYRKELGVVAGHRHCCRRADRHRRYLCSAGAAKIPEAAGADRQFEPGSQRESDRTSCHSRLQRREISGGQIRRGEQRADKDQSIRKQCVISNDAEHYSDHERSEPSDILDRCSDDPECRSRRQNGTVLRHDRLLLLCHAGRHGLHDADHHLYPYAACTCLSQAD
ncbi:hypothetical protein D3C75_633220 [compost metagenome]